MNLLKLESSKIRVRKKRIRATLNDSYRDKILMGQSFYMRLPWVLLVLLGVVVAGLTAFAPLCEAQETAGTEGPARPKAKHDMVMSYGPHDYKVFLYIEEGKKAGEGTAHVFYSPVLYVVTNEDKTIKHKIKMEGTEDGVQVLIFVFLETDQEALHKAIREKLESLAKRAEGTVPYGVPYRIQPLAMSRSWFESGQRADGAPKFRSVDLASTTLAEETVFPVSFYVETEDDAALLIAGLEEDAPLNYHYVFAGIAADACTVEFKADKIRNIGRFKDLSREGKENYVSRRQAVEIADEIASEGDVEARCEDWTIGQWITEEIMRRVEVAKESVQFRSWKELDEFARFDPDSFKADMETMLRDIEKHVQSTTDSESWAKGESDAWSKAGEGSVSLTGGGEALFGLASGFFGVGMKTSRSAAQAEAWAEAKNEFSNRLEKRGLYGEFKGARYRPKSVDIYSKEKLRNAWSRDMKLTYIQLRGRAETSNFLLPRTAYKLSPEIAAWRIETEIGRLQRYVRTEVAELRNRLTEVDAQSYAASNLAREAQIDASEALEKIEKLRRLR